eukprot:SAG31_NODE_8753_length_1394_cov_1.398456_2_plen_110_part_00
MFSLCFQPRAQPIAVRLRGCTCNQDHDHLNHLTQTVYEKGAEVIRMYETLLGKEGFRAGMDLYFARHDGQVCPTSFTVRVDAAASLVCTITEAQVLACPAINLHTGGNV